MVDNNEQRRLRSLPAAELLPPAPTSTPMKVTVVVPKIDPRIATLYALAESLGYDLTPTSNNRREIALSLLNRMRPRSSTHVYQAAAYSLFNIPRECMQKILPGDLVTTETTAVMTWRMETMQDLSRSLEPLLNVYGSNSAGLTKPITTQSELFVRVVATMLPPMEISHVKMARGVDRIYINMQWILMDQAGELHPPKDAKRNEMALAPELEAEMRAKVLADAAMLHEHGTQLSPAWLRQLGVDDRERTALMLNAPAAMEKKRPSKRKASTFNAETILAETSTQYLVRWEGYDSSWEAWRISGAVGSPLETWEPKSNLMGSLALEQWQA